MVTQQRVSARDYLDACTPLDKKDLLSIEMIRLHYGIPPNFGYSLYEGPLGCQSIDLT